MNAVINMPACPMLLRTVRVNGHDVPLRVFGKMANGGIDDHTCVNVRFIPLMKDGSLDECVAHARDFSRELAALILCCAEHTFFFLLLFAVAYSIIKGRSKSLPSS